MVTYFVYIPTFTGKRVKRVTFSDTHTVYIRKVKSSRIVCIFNYYLFYLYYLFMLPSIGK